MGVRWLISFSWCDKPRELHEARLPISPQCLLVSSLGNPTRFYCMSTWPLPCGYLGDDMCCLIPYFVKNLVIYLPMNYNSLSMSNDCRQPNRQMMFFRENRLTSASLVKDRASASIHLVKYLV